ncbi:MAG TPA: glycosyltransferase [Gemmatimonadales bacterium]|nr:glycosyltransferase [Gemmatimonadales bacterium]
MRVLLSTIGSRGDVQPLVALALELRAFNHDIRLCVPPDFREWIEGLGFAVTPIGPELRRMTTSGPPVMPSAGQRRRLAEASVAAQFTTIAQAAQGCDLILGATALQIAARSVAEQMGIPYVFVVYCPNVLPSAHHAPPPLPPLPGEAPIDPADNRALWARDTARFNSLFGEALNAHRKAVGLAPVTDVRSHVLTDTPWLAADPVLGPWPDVLDPVFQPGAWIVPDKRPLSPEIERFLDAGSSPVYFGFGSIRAPEQLARVLIDAARALDRRAIISRGWADVSLLDPGPDCLLIGEVNQQQLFTRVAAVVHHGGAGTTAAAALAGTPQVIIPQVYDQHYWARRVEELDIGSAHAPGAPTSESLLPALERALRPSVAEKASIVATKVRWDGARVAAEELGSVIPTGGWR